MEVSGGGNGGQRSPPRPCGMVVVGRLTSVSSSASLSIKPLFFFVGRRRRWTVMVSFSSFFFFFDAMLRWPAPQGELSSFHATQEASIPAAQRWRRAVAVVAP